MRILLLLVLAGVANAVHAADIFAPVPGDLSLTMLLQPIFGSLFGGAGDGPLGESIQVFNVACLTIGGLLAAYTLVFGTVQTAHDGEMLGRKWSSMWVPIRLVVGTAAIIPVSGGYCVAQMLVAWLTIQGIGLADSVWSAFTHSSIASQSLASAAAPVPNVSRLGFGLLRSQVCMKGFARLTHDGMGTIFTGPPVTDGNINTLRRYGVPGLSATQCGGVVGSQASSGAMASTAGFFGINTGAAEQAAVIRRAHAAATLALESELAPLAEAIVNGNVDGAEAAYIAAVNRYQQSIGVAAKAQMGDKSYFAQMSKSSSDDGWMLASAWFMRLVAVEDALMKALADAPTVMPVEAAPMGMASDMDRHYNAMAGAVRDASLTGLDNQLVADRAREDSESGIIASAVNSVFRNIFQGGFNFLSEADSQRHPLLVASSAGHTLINLAVALMFGSILMAKLGGVTVAMVMAGLVLALLGSGVTLAYVLPLLPFIIFVAGIAHWCLAVMEAIIGAPLWAVSHLNPNGDGLSPARSGYLLVLDLTLKPVLMILGFCFALLVSMPLGQFINKVFIGTFEFAQQGTFTGFVSMLAAVAIYSAVMLTMLRTSFGFIHRVPDQVMKWIGGGQGSGLAEAGGAGTAVEHQSGVVTGAVTGAVAGATTSKLNNMAHRDRKAASSRDTNAIDPGAGLHREAAAHLAREASKQCDESAQTTDQQIEDSVRQAEGKKE